MKQSSYNSVQKAELHAILMVLRDFKEPLNVATDSHMQKRSCILKFIADDTELTLLFIQVQDIISSRLCPICITCIQTHMGLPGPLAQGNAESA